MTALKNTLMTAEEFYAWAEEQEQGFELFDGVPVAMSPERVVHSNTKFQVCMALRDGIAKGHLPSHMVPDGPAVRIDTRNSYQPDAMVYCGDRVAGKSIVIPNPAIVVEVLSPGNAMKDLRDKLVGYFRVPSIEHYLIVDPEKRLVIHHARADATIATRVVSEGTITLAPPGLEVTVEALLPLPEE